MGSRSSGGINFGEAIFSQSKVASTAACATMGEIHFDGALPPRHRGQGDALNHFCASIHSTNWRGERILIP